MKNAVTPNKERSHGTDDWFTAVRVREWESRTV